MNVFMFDIFIVNKFLNKIIHLIKHFIITTTTTCFSSENKQSIKSKYCYSSDIESLCVPDGVEQFLFQFFEAVVPRNVQAVETGVRFR